MLTEFVLETQGHNNDMFWRNNKSIQARNDQDRVFFLKLLKISSISGAACLLNLSAIYDLFLN